jgi:hypothetical protein
VEAVEDLVDLVAVDLVVEEVVVVGKLTGYKIFNKNARLAYKPRVFLLTHIYK